MSSSTVGAAGGGKSKALVMDALLHCLEVSGFQAYMFRKTYPELEDTLINEAKKSIPPGLGKYRQSDHKWTFPNGSAIFFRHCASMKDAYIYQGAQIHALYIDELTQFGKDIFDYLSSRVRIPDDIRDGSGHIPKAQTKCATNPGGVGHGWVKAMFIDPMPQGGRAARDILLEEMGEPIHRTFEFVPAFLKDNSHLGTEYAIQLRSLPQALYDALLYGKWDTFAGQVFTEWRDDPEHYGDGLHTHVITPFEIPIHWPRYCSMDYGVSKPFSIGWWAVGPDNRVYRYREWYGCGDPVGRPNVGISLSCQEIAQGIQEREAEETRRGIRIYRVGDPAIWKDGTGYGRGEVIGNLFERYGASFVPADNNRLSGKMQLHNRLRFLEDGKPMIQIFRTCRDFIRTVPMLVYSQTHVEDVDTDGEDHCITGDTLIDTDTGYRTIESMVGTTGKVRSSDGKYHRYGSVRRTQRQAAVFEVTLDDGSVVRATAEHRIMLKDGNWKQLSALLPGDELRQVKTHPSRDSSVEPTTI